MWSSYDHTTVKAPHPIRTAKLSTVGPDQYYGRGLRGNLRCCMAFYFYFYFLDLVVLVGTRMDDRLVGQAAGCYFYFFAQVKNPRGPGHQGPDRVGPGSNPSRVRGKFWVYS